MFKQKSRKMCGVVLAITTLLYACASQDSPPTTTSISNTDSIAPQPSGVLAFTGISANAVTVSWAAAIDDSTPTSNLRYRLVWASSADQLDSLAKIDSVAADQVAVHYVAGIGSYPVLGLSAGTTYHFALVVADLANNKAVYPLGLTTTSTVIDSVPPATGAAITFGDIQSRYIEVLWGPATDNITQSVFLQYRLVKDNLSQSNIDSLAEAEAKSGADLVMDYATNASAFTVQGLLPATQYYFALIVRDAAGNKTLYTPASANTTANDFFRNTLKFRLNGTDMNWNIVWQPSFFRVGKTGGDDTFNHLFSVLALGTPPVSGFYTELDADFQTTVGGTQYSASCSGASLMLFLVVTAGEITGNFSGTLRNCLLPEGSPGASVPLDSGIFRANR